MVKKSETASTSDPNANTVSNQHDSDSDDIDDAKLTRAIANLVMSIPKPQKRDNNNSESVDSPKRTVASTSATPESGECNWPRFGTAF